MKKMIKSIKVRLDPNNKQLTKLFQYAGCARFAYNWAINRKDDEANKLLDKMLKNGVKKKTKIYTNSSKEIKEELLGFILTLSSDCWDIVLDTENGIMKTILHSYEYGDILEKGKINEDVCRIITEIVAEKLGIETSKTIGLVSK